MCDCTYLPEQQRQGTDRSACVLSGHRDVVVDGESLDYELMK